MLDVVVGTSCASVSSKMQVAQLQWLEIIANDLSQSLLMQFLSVLGVIEGMYTFGKSVSVE